MRSLTCVSSARRLRTEPELEELLVSAPAWNRPRGLTGMFALQRRNFIQSVESAGDAVAEVFARISGDSRHPGFPSDVG